MNILADLHIHSKYSRATSKECTPEFLDLWARKKGLQLLGTGDFTHPAWRQELAEKLTPAEDGLYRLKDSFLLSEAAGFSGMAPRFVLSGEISSIYKKNGRVRKVHNVILLPSLESAQLLSKKLEAIGNIHSDGRPILGLDCRDLLEITLETCPDAIFIPAHIWTPHFSLFGAFSGFDTIEECFEDLTPHIHALETGLSSDPPMNWRVSMLDRFALISNSDAHSPQKLGREANLLDMELCYQGLFDALQGVRPQSLCGTIEFFPEEGKYHWDGHRNCHLRLTPAQTAQYGGKCPVCGKKITIGVEHRVEQLADRPAGFQLPQGRPYESLVPLPEVIGAANGISPTGKKTAALYESMLRKLGAEFDILRTVPLSDIRHAAGDATAEGIRRLRTGKVERIPGYDGEYGTISLLEPWEIDAFQGQIRLFTGSTGKKEAAKAPAPSKKAASPTLTPASPAAQSLNESQREAVTAEESVVAVIAGPGTGKTKTLVCRIIDLIENRGVKPSEITAVTFTNKAAAEIKERLAAHFSNRRTAQGVTVGTFHAICLQLLKKQKEAPTLLSPGNGLELAASIIKALDLSMAPRQLLQEISHSKATGAQPDDTRRLYDARLQEMGVVDFDDLLLQVLSRWEVPQPPRNSAFSHLLVDEFQDVNDLQYRLVQAWSRRGKSLFLIGDPDQSIYGFRGSDAHCFDRLLTDVPNIKVITLTENYRSAPNILRCALSVIDPQGQNPRILVPHLSGEDPIYHSTTASPLSEGIFIAKEINRLTGGMDLLDSQAFSGKGKAEKSSYGFSDFAILCRTRRQMHLLEKCLQKESIPYLITGADDCLSDSHVRGSEAFFRFLRIPNSLTDLSLALELAFHLPADLQNRLMTLFAENTIADLTDPMVKDLLAPYSDVGSCRLWIRMMEKYLPIMSREKPAVLLEQWSSDMGWSEEAPLNQWINMSVFHNDMASFLDHLLLAREGDLSRSAQRSYSPDCVRLMTLHSAKGLEFPVVFLTGVNEGILPLTSVTRPIDPAEERRLFYVGITRAKERLYLLSDKEAPSPFLADIPKELLEPIAISPRKSDYMAKQLTLF